ncbi:MAG TPA: hypothetical protein VKH19_18245 [Gemmatimonadaceae bacterium]|nr:hypothetical protein [Gemmatimonadaceae bacterium]
MEKGSERPNLSTIVSPELAWRHAKERTTLLHGWPLGIVWGLAAVIPGIAVTAELGGAADMKVAFISALATWGALGLVVVGELVWRRATSPAVILAERLMKAGVANDGLARRIGTLEKAQQTRQDRAVGVNAILQVNAKGKALRMRIYSSTEEQLPFAQVQVEFQMWRVEVTAVVGHYVGSAAASEVDDVLTVAEIEYVGMPQGPNRFERIRIMLNIDERIRRLSALATTYERGDV